MTETIQRMAWLDVLKGIAIMFVVLGHNPITSVHPKVFNIIFSFHIPLFFFISGYLFNPERTFSNHIRKRFNALLKPYIFTIFLISLVYLLVKCDKSLWWYLIWTLYGNGPNLPKAALHLWFLPHLFLVSLFVWALFKYIKIFNSSIIAQLIVVAILLVSGVLGLHLFWNVTIPISISNLFSMDLNSFLMDGLLQNPAYAKVQLLNDKQFFLKGLPFSADIILVTASFFIIGYFLRINNLEFIFYRHSIALLMVALFAVLHIFYNNTIDLNLRRYDNLLISTLLACAGISLCAYASIAITSINNISTIMQYVGRYALVIYILHPILQGKVYYSIASLLPTAECIAILPAFVAGIGLPLLVNWLLLERFKFFRYWYYAK